MMPFNFLLIFALLNLAFAGTHATLTKEERYWKSVFPKTQMPKALHDILPRYGRRTKIQDDLGPETFLPFTWYAHDQNYNNWNYDYNIWDLDYDYNDNDYDYDENYDQRYDEDYNYDADYNYAPAPGNEFEGHDHALAPSNRFGGHALAPSNRFGGHGHAASNNRVNDSISGNRYSWSRLAPGNKFGSHDHVAPNNKGVNGSTFGNLDSWRRQSDYSNYLAINETIYFFLENLHPGKKMNLQRLTEKKDKTLFLPQEIAESIPMSKDKVLEIFKTFSLKANSSYADSVGRAIRSCERAEIRGEKKYCATSLESFIDLSVSMLGKNIKLWTHQLGKGPKNPMFTIRRGKRDMGDKNIACHKMRYPYAAYLCHFIKNTTLYQVPLVSMDGTKVNALAICHKDSRGWSPNHISFLFLKIKPGTIPICHFVSRDTVIWVSN